MTSSSTSPGRLFVVLWLFTLLTELISLQIRLAIFGGTGWLTFIKFTSLLDKLGFVAIMAILCAAFCGIWTLLFDAVGRKLQTDAAKIQRRCATSWVVIIAIDLVFRHKITELLGNAFDFFEFATGVGGVWRMLEQAFQWYGDVIVMAVLGIAAVTAATWGFFRWFFKPSSKPSCLERIPCSVLYSLIGISLLLGLGFMSIMAPHFPGTHKLLASETMFGSALNALVNVTSDFDGDGYGAFDLPPDEAPLDARLHPHAIDIPDDNMDQDFLLGDLKTAEIPEYARQRTDLMGTGANQSIANRRHVVVVLMESVRHDMLDAQIQGQPVMPELKKFEANGALRIDGAFATRGFTQNSVTQTFWGSFYQPGHSLVDDFKALGYHTAAFSGESLLDEKFDESLGWNRAGDTVVDPRFITSHVNGYGTVPARVLMDELEPFLDKYDPSQPLFLYVFYQDPHFPYQQDNPSVLNDRHIKRTEIAAETRPRLWHTYANQVHHLDKAAGRLIRALESKQMLDDALVIFISDHGESLFDDGYLLGHGIAIQDAMTHAVMLVHGARHDIPSMLTHVDLRQIILKELTAPSGKAQITSTEAPVLQFIGSPYTPSAISHRYPDGSRVTWEFASRSAWRDAVNACYPHQQEIFVMPDHGMSPIDTQIKDDSTFVPTGIYRSTIHHPTQDPQVRALIQDWEYMQWRHQK